MATDRDGSTISAGDDVVLVGKARGISGARVPVVLGSGKTIVCTDAELLLAASLRAIEHVLTGQATGPATAIPLGLPNGIEPSSTLGVPVIDDVVARSIAISIVHGTPGAGTWTATLFRTRGGSTTSVATFTFDL